MLDLIIILAFCALGVLVGIITGLLPGLHVNNIALILLSLSSSIVVIFSFLNNIGFSDQFILLLIAGFITSVSLSHTFHDVIPTTFIGAPDEDTALTVLPAHSMLTSGDAYKAIALSAMGSFGAIVVCLFLFYVIRFIIGSPLFLYESLQEIMVFVLVAISILMIGTETAKIKEFGKTTKLHIVGGMLFALFVFIFSGIFGLIILDYYLESPIGMSAPVLFPALAGLFGMPTLLNSLNDKPKIPKQKLETLSLSKKEKKSSILSIFAGSISGILVSIIPGITSATGTVIAMKTRDSSGNEQTIITLSAVNTASAFSVILMLFIILRPRSGAAIAIHELISVEEWIELLAPVNLIYLLIFLVFAGMLSYFSTLFIGKMAAKYFSRVPYDKILKATILLITILVFLFTGLLGFLILISATLIGFLPILWGVRRSHCMGVLLIPIIIHFI